jgi:hypothetical protein
MRLPKPRGPLSERVFASLAAYAAGSSVDGVDASVAESAEDAAITLWSLYELAYAGFEEVDDAAEWDPGLLAVRRELETDFEQRLRARWPGVPEHSGVFGDALLAMIEGHDGRSLAAYVRSEATTEQVLDLLRLRSIYHLKEADPTAWVVPRLPVAPKAALAELQYDEYGGGDPDALHTRLFERGLAAVGLRAERGAYVDEAPLEVLEQNNAMSLFGLHRRLRGAALGHLAAFEATSSLPSRRMSQGLARLELAPELIAYYDEHVEADAVHEQLAVRTICGSLVAVEPTVEPDVWFGAFTCLDLEDRLAAYLLDQWEAA